MLCKLYPESVLEKSWHRSTMNNSAEIKKLRKIIRNIEIRRCAESASRFKLLMENEKLRDEIKKLRLNTKMT